MVRESEPQDSVTRSLGCRVGCEHRERTGSEGAAGGGGSGDPSSVTAAAGDRPREEAAAFPGLPTQQV